MNAAFEVSDTPEMRRVLALPRRDWKVAIQHNDLYKRMTQAYRVPGGTQELRLIQAACLAEAHDTGGLFAPVGAGEGKTLIQYLLPVVMPNIQRPMAVVPSGLVDKTWDEFKEYQKHWVCHPAFMTRDRFLEHIIGYQSLGRDSGRDALQHKLPQLVIPDEVHYLANREGAARAKRFDRFMLANPNTIVCGMSGTISNRSIMEYWHIAYWCLKSRLFLPRVQAEAERWSDVLDEKKTDSIGRRGIGAMWFLFNDEEKKIAFPERTAPLGRTQQMPNFFYEDQTRMARKAYARRMVDTPGVICSTDERPACSLRIVRHDIEPNETVKQHLRNLRPKGDMPGFTPNGEVVTTPFEMWRIARQIACGFYYKWVPAAPKEWLSARNTWNWLVQQVTQPDGQLREKYAHLHLDSPFQVALAITGANSETFDEDASARAAGLDPDAIPDGYTIYDWRDDEGRSIRDPVYAQRVAHERKASITDPTLVTAYQKWAAIRGTFKVNVVDEWVDDTVLKFCVEWMRKKGSGIVWTEHRGFGKRLAQLLGTGFCSDKGRDENKKTLESYAGRPVVASTSANSEGRNLQAWHNNLVVTIMPLGKLVEQNIARTHRQYQKADTVYWEYVVACEEQDRGFDQIMADARYAQDTLKKSQRILYGDHV